MRSGGQRYRKRRPLPAFLLILVLGIAATIVWFKIMNKDDEAMGAAHCDPPPTRTSAASAATPPPTLGKALETGALDRTAPASPATALLRVTNAGGQRGQAKLVTESLRALGFTQIGEPDSDPLYGDSLMACRAQIRFGAQGTAAARTISLVDPCAELIRDNRQDATVDYAIGEKFDDVSPNRSARTLLEQLNDFAKQNAPAQGGLQADPKQPNLDSGLLTAARNVKC
jgi:hypothetical protein